MKNTRDLFNLKGRIAIITGGAGLLGTKHAEAIADFEGTPVLIDIDQAKIDYVVKGLKEKYNVDASGYLCDITKKENIENVRDSVLKKYGHIDILINNAAIDPKVKSDATVNLSRFENFLLEQWNLEVAVGLSGAMLCAQVFGTQMAKQRHGVILNISSDLGIIAPDQRLYKKPGLADDQQPVKPVTYSVIKHGLIGLTKYLATYWAGQGVRANTLCPGGVYNNQPDEFVQKISNLIPMGRMADKDELKGAIIYLISDASSYLNGATLIVDGGRSVL
jgi:NAD(P)-dependent dehydrogenase (short-subunit alcohol dehydrogenase family)